MTLLPEVAAEIQLMLDELESNRLEVCLVPCRQRVNEGGMIRVAVSRNAKWYRDFCASRPSSRIRKNAAPDTIIKRRGTRRALEALLAGRESSIYSSQLLAIASSRLRRARNVTPGEARAMTLKLAGGCS